MARLAHTVYAPDADRAGAGRGVPDRAPRRSTAGRTAYDGSRAGSSQQLKSMTSYLIGRFCSAVEAATHATYGDRAARSVRRRPGGRAVADPARDRRAQGHRRALRDERGDEPQRRAGGPRARGADARSPSACSPSAPRHPLDRAFQDDWAQAVNDAARCRVVVDQVASLTDPSALAWHARGWLTLEDREASRQVALRVGVVLPGGAVGVELLLELVLVRGAERRVRRPPPTPRSRPAAGDLLGRDRSLLLRGLGHRGGGGADVRVVLDAVGSGS